MKCPKCGSEMKPPYGCVGCQWRYRNDYIAVSMCFNCIRTITIDGQHELYDIDNYLHKCGHEEKVKEED